MKKSPQNTGLKQNSQELITSYYSASTVRMACPLCREIGKDSDGTHLQIGNGKVWCYSDTEHGPRLKGEIKRAEYDGSAELKPRKPPPAKPKKIKFVKSLPRGTQYEYRDQSGNLLFVAVRKENPKKFYQYTVVKGGYETRGYGPDRPLYRLNHIKSDGPVIVVEGEKCVHALIDAGCDLSVTTFSQGSGSWRKTDYKALAGRQVWLVADADEAGRKCMRQLAEHLYGLSCKIKVMLPAGESKEDVADWLEKHDLETVIDTIECGLVDYVPSDSDDPFEALRMEIERTISSDDNTLLAELLEDAKTGYFRSVKENYRYGWIIGRTLNHLVDRKPDRRHGDLKEIYNSYLIDPNLAYRCRKIATVPWEKAQRFPSTAKCLDYIRSRNPKPTKTEISEVKRSAQEKEIADLKSLNERILADSPDSAHYEATIEQLKRENAVLKKRNLEKVKQERKDKSRIAKLETENRQLQSQLDVMLAADNEIRSITKDYSTNLDGATDIRNITNLDGHGQPGLDLGEYTGVPDIGKWDEKLE